MTNKQLQDFLAKHPDDMPIRILTHHTLTAFPKELDEENILLSSQTAYVDSSAPRDEWDNEEGKVELGDGQQYLLFNPIIF